MDPWADAHLCCAAASFTLSPYASLIKRFSHRAHPIDHQSCKADGKFAFNHTLEGTHPDIFWYQVSGFMLLLRQNGVPLNSNKVLAQF